jgi:hypothetical protein
LENRLTDRGDGSPRSAHLFRGRPRAGPAHCLSFVLTKGPALFRGTSARPCQRGRDFADEVGGGNFLAGGFLEQEEGGQGLAGNVQGSEDGHHLVGELADLGGLPFRQVGDGEIEEARAASKALPSSRNIWRTFVRS